MSLERRIFGSESEKVARAEPREGQTDKKIVPGMREDARAQAAAVESEQTEEHAEGGEQDHAAREKWARVKGKGLVELSGIEPLASSLRTRRSPS